MHLKIHKSHRLLRFLNTDHGLFVRLFFGTAAFIGVLLITGRGVLARSAFNNYRYDPSLKAVFRRMSWYMRRGWMRLDVSRDKIFDFTDGLNAAELHALRAFLNRRASAADPTINACDQLYVSARLAMMDLEHEDWADRLAEFYDRGDALLALLSKIPDGTAPQQMTRPRKEDVFVSEATQALSDFATLFPIQNTPWFVISGTFLGLVRENGFLPHDYDIDLGLNVEDGDLESIAARLHDSAEFIVRKLDIQQEFFIDDGDTLAKIRRPALLKFFHVNGISFDLFLHYKSGENRWHGSSLHRWDNTDFELTPYEMSGQTVLGPANADLYLTENYGTWRVPVFEFNSTTDTTNQSVVNAPTSIAMFLRRMSLNWQRDAKAADDLKRFLVRGGYLTEAPSGLRMNRSGLQRPPI